MDFLARADEPHEDAPLGDALAEVDERLGLDTGERQRVLGGDLLDVPGALRLVVDDDVLRRHRGAVAEVLLHVVLDVADEGLAVAAGAAQLVLKHLDEGAVSAEEDRRRRWLAAGPLHREVGQGWVWTARRPTSVLPDPGTPVTRTRCRVLVLAAS